MSTSKLSRRDFLRATGLLSAGALAACAAPSQPAPAPAAKQAEAPKEAAKAPEAAKPAGEAVSLSMMWRTNPDENPMIDELIKSYKEKNANVNMTGTIVPWEEYEPKLMTLYAANQAPDVYGTGGTNPYIERWVRGMVRELDQFLANEPKSFTDDLFPIALNSYKKKGKTAALTFAICAAGTWINATRFDEAGVKYPSTDWADQKAWTWDDMIETAKKLTVVKDGKTEKFGVNPGHTGPWYYTRLWGQDLVGADDYNSGVLHGFQTNKPEVLDALVNSIQARADAIWKHKVTPSPDTAQSLNQMGPMLKTGAVAMEFAGGWAVWGDMPKDFKFRAAVNPKGGPNGAGTRVQNIWAEPLQISSQTKQPNEAWKWVKFMTVDPDAIKIELAHRNLIPAAQSSFQTFADAQANRLTAMTVDEQAAFYKGSVLQANTTVPDHILVGWAKVRDVMNSAMEPVWLNQKTAQEAVNDMLPKVQAAIDANLKELGLT